VNLREWALSQGIHPQTAYRWYRQGKLPVPAQKMGKLILVGDLEATTQASPGRAAVSARVSSGDQRPDLDRQVARVVAWATEHGH
jgi:putative resolvase